MGSSLMLKRRAGKAGYEATLGSINTPVIIGGSDSDNPDEFEPAMNASFHPTAKHPRGEAFLHMRHIDGLKTGRVETEANGEITHEAGGQKNIFKALDDDNLKWDIEYPDAGSVPSSISIRISHSGNLSFHKQIITQEHFDLGSRYGVPEAEGSYAVYFNNGRRDNKYQTGKCAHIFSGFFLDQIGAKSPLLKMTLVDIETNVKRLSHIVTPKVQAWLDDPKRVGKIRLDPTVGYATKGSAATRGSAPAQHWHVSPSQAAGSGAVTAFHLYVHSNVNNGNAKMAVYNADPNPRHYDAGLLLHASTDSELIPNADVLYSYSSINPVRDIVPGDWYRMGWAFDEGNINVWYDNLGDPSDFIQISGEGYANFPSDTSTAAGNFDRWTWSMWAEYGAVAVSFNRSRIVNMGATGPQNRSTIANA